MGGPRRTPGESVDALEEAIGIIRAFWSGERSVNFEGEHYRVRGAKPGPPPAHDIGLWIGAYGPRMLRLTGRLGDGWLPSLGGHYMSAEAAPRMHAAIDEAGERGGRDPAQIERAVNLMSLDGDPGGWRRSSRGLRRSCASRRFSSGFPRTTRWASSGASERRRRQCCGASSARRRSGRIDKRRSGSFAQAAANRPRR